MYMLRLGKTVEIGHVYSPERLIPLAPEGEGDFWSDNLGREFSYSLEAKELRDLVGQHLGRTGVKVVALVDDCRARQKQKNSVDSWRWQAFINASAESVRLGTGAEFVQFESDLEANGRTLIDKITQISFPRGYRLSQDGRKLKLPKSSGTIRLMGKDGVDDPTYPSCEILDLAWLQKRLDIAPETITILPGSYLPQQERTAILADLVGIDSDSYSTVLYPNR